MAYFYSTLNYKLFSFFWIPINAFENMVKNPLAAHFKRDYIVTNLYDAVSFLNLTIPLTHPLSHICYG